MGDEGDQVTPEDIINLVLLVSILVNLLALRIQGRISDRFDDMLRRMK